MSAQSDFHDGGSFAALANRAFAFLDDRGGAATADDLARELFGPTAKGPLWAKMLERVLGRDPRFTRAAGDHWALAGREVGLTPLDAVDFVVLDVEATGLKPWRQRVVEVAALRLAGDRAVDSFAAIVNPERRLPKYLAELAGLSQEDLAEAPTFAAVAGPLSSFLEGVVLVGHGLNLDLGYLRHELSRLGLPPLANPVVDTLDLAGRLLPGRGKPTLDNLAALLGIPVGRRHRAHADARLVANVFTHLLALARSQGAAILADLLPQAPAAGARYALLDASPLREVPEGPGVYLLKDAAGGVVYVGKAVNLRARLATYFSRPPDYVRRMEGLLEAVADVEAVPLGSELEALLEEARLIAAHQPRFNVQQHTKAQPAFLRLDPAARYPRLTTCAEPAGDDARYWGPFRNGLAAREAARTLNEIFPLRAVRRRLGPKRRRKAKSTDGQLAFGRAPEPDSLTLLHDEYDNLVGELERFLDGELDATVERLQAAMHAAVEAGDRPRVATLRKWLRAARLFALDLRPDWQPRATASVAVVQPSAVEGAAEVFVLYGGRFGGRLRLDTCDSEAPEVAASLREMAANAVDGDAANIVARWLGAAPDRPAVALPEGESGWEGAAARVLRLADDVSAEGDGAADWDEDGV